MSSSIFYGTSQKNQVTGQPIFSAKETVRLQTDSEGQFLMFFRMSSYTLDEIQTAAAAADASGSATKIELYVEQEVKRDDQGNFPFAFLKTGSSTMAFFYKTL